MRVRLAYGRTGLLIDLPEQVTIDLIEPTFVPGCPHEPTTIRNALRNPISSPPLTELVREDDRVCIVFSDLTRPMPNDRVLPVLLEELNLAGVPPEAVVLLNALGTHRPQTEAELQSMLGVSIAQEYKIIQHDAWDDANLVEVGRNRYGRPVCVNRSYIESSVRILTGFIEPHMFAGFSGGGKAVLPGIANVEAILDNHGPDMISAPSATWAVTEGNPLWEEIQGIAHATSPTFLLNVTLNRDRQITGVYGGELRAAYQAGIQFARETAVHPVSEPFDIVITSNSGYPLDLNLYQAVKGMSAAAQIVRPGGDIIVAAECWDGIPEHGEYKRLLWQAESVDELLATVTAPGFRCHDQWEAQTQAQVQRKARVHVYAGGLGAEELRNALVIPCLSIENTVARVLERNPQASIAVLPEGPQTVPVLEHGSAD